jgi:hypothetical protein
MFISRQELKIKKYQYMNIFLKKSLRPICTESFRPGLSPKPGLKLEKGLKSYVYLKT